MLRTHKNMCASTFQPTKFGVGVVAFTCIIELISKMKLYMKYVGLVVKNVFMIMPAFTPTAHLNAMTKGLKTLRYPTSRT